jgi:hypothetical protein
MAILDLISHVHLASFVTMLPKNLKYSILSSCFWSIITCIVEGYLNSIITLVFSHPFPFHRIYQFHLFYQSCPVSRFSLTISSKLSAYFTVRITCPPPLNPPDHSGATLVRYTLYKLNRNGDKQNPYLNSLPVFKLGDSPLSSISLTLWSMYAQFCFQLFNASFLQDPH